MGIIDKLLRRRPSGDPNYYRQRINSYLDQERYRKAIRECELYFRCCETNDEKYKAAVQQYYGYCFFQIKKYDRAVTELQKVFTMNASDGIKHLAYSNLGNAFRNLGNKDLAKEAFERALSFAPTSSHRQIVELFLRDLHK